MTLDDVDARMRARYGVRTHWGAIVTTALIGLVAAVLVGGMVWQRVNPSIPSQLLAFRVVSPSLVEVTWEVTPGSGGAVCAIRAQDTSRADVGYAVVTVTDPGTGTVQGTYPLATRDTATIAEVLGCGADANSLDVPDPQFPPGTSNPPQQATFGGS